MYAKKKTRKIRLLSVLLMLCMVIGLFPMTAFADGPQGQNTKLVSVERYMGAYTISPNGEPNAYYSEAQAVLEGIQTEIKTDDGKTLKVDIDWNWSQYGLPGDDPVMFARIPAAQQEFIGEVVLPDDIDQNGVALTVRAVVEVPFENYEVITMLNDYAYGQISTSLFGIPEGHRYDCLVTPNTGYEIEMVLVNDENYMGMLAKTTNGYEFSFPVTKNTEVRAYLKPEGTSAADSYNLTTAVHTGGGSISDSKTNLPKNSVETVVITPETDYEIDTIKVNGVDRTAFVNNNKLQITMDYHKEVVVTFKEKTGGGTTTTYDVWVDDKQVTSDNKDDILNDGSTAFYDPNSQTLTLNGYNGGAIRADHALTVTLADGSENTVINPANNQVYCISANNNDLTINGSGDLKVIQNRYNCSAIAADPDSGNLIIDMAGDLNVTTYNWHGLYAYGSVTISGSGDVSICIEGKWNGTKGTGIVSGTEDVILSGSGKLTVDAQNAACAVRLKASGKALLLNGTGAPLSFSAGTYAAIVNQADKTYPVGGTNLAFYNEVTGAPDTEYVVYDHTIVPITEVDVSDITLPVAGATPDYDGSLPVGAAYHFASKAELATLSYNDQDKNVNGIWWYNVTDSRYMASTDTFISGKEYRVEAVVLQNSGYEFASNLVCSINDDDQLVDLAITSIGSNTWLVSKPFTVTDPVLTLYDITVNSTTNGTVTSDKAKAYKGEKVTLTVTSGSGYELDKLEVMQGRIEIPVCSDNSFIMPEGNVIVNATFKSKAPAQTSYTLTTTVTGGHGTIDPLGSKEIVRNEVVTIIFKPDKGYEIDKVTVNGVETGVLANVLDVAMDRNKTIVVTYKKTQEGITGGNAGNDPLNPGGNTDGNTGGNISGFGQTTSPQTGDNSNMLLWIALMFASCGGIVIIFFVRRKRAHSK